MTSPPESAPLADLISLAAKHLQELARLNQRRDRWMMFVDGENFAIRGQPFVAESGVTLPKRHFEADVFLWVPGLARYISRLYLFDTDLNLPGQPERAFDYTSVIADDRGLLGVRLALRRQNFTPVVFKKIRRDQKAKGIDIALTRDMLILPHSDFGDPECCGLFFAVERGDQSDITCNECGLILKSVPSADLRRTLDEMELTLDVASEKCPHCGGVNLFPSFSRRRVFICRECDGALRWKNCPGR